MSIHTRRLFLTRHFSLHRIIGMRWHFFDFTLYPRRPGVVAGWSLTGFGWTINYFAN